MIPVIKIQKAQNSPSRNENQLQYDQNRSRSNSKSPNKRKGDYIDFFPYTNVKKIKEDVIQPENSNGFIIFLIK